MDGTHQTRLETLNERLARIRREDAIIAQGMTELAADLTIDGEELEAWFEALDKDNNAPPPALLKTA